MKLIENETIHIFLKIFSMKANHKLNYNGLIHFCFDTQCVI